MADWFVRPNTSHSATRDGKSYANAFGGWSEIQWGAGFVNTGDTLYVCGAHNYTASSSISVTGLTIRGDYFVESGSLSYTGAGIYFNPNKNSTTVLGLTITSQNRCIVPGGTPIDGLTIRNCTLNGSSSPIIEFLSIANWAWTNITIDGNTFNGGVVGGTAGAALWWFPQTAINTYIENIKITNNKFNNCSSSQGTIVLLANATAAPTVHIYDMEISGNTFTNCGGTAIKTYVPQTGRCKGVKISRNTILNQARVGDLGGGISIGGFVQTDTANFGQNVIEYNYADGLEGTSGFANVMYGSYVIRYNTAKNISSVIYDGVGILFDHGADGCVAYGNYFENMWGTAGDFSAGAGIGIIFEATNITCYGNVVKNCHVGLLYGNQTAGRVSNVYNNTFLDCGLAGVRATVTIPADSNWCRNNIFTASSPSSVAIRYENGQWDRETNNIFYGFATGTQALSASSTNVNPNLDGDYRPQAVEAIRKGTYQGGKDYYGKHYYNPPNIGAVEDMTTAPRYILKKR